MIENNRKTIRSGFPKLRDSMVLSTLALISAYLLIDGIHHYIAPVLSDNIQAHQHTPDEAFIRVLLFLSLFVCCIYVWHRFRSEVRVRSELDRALQERADEMTKFQNILESMPARISIQSREFKVLYQNPAHREAIGDRAGEYCYKAYRNFDDVCDGCPLVKTFADGGSYSHLATNQINGEERNVEIVTAPLKKADGTIVAAIEVVQDITDMLRYEQDIINLSIRLEEGNRELRAFSSALAHDLRQPITRTYMAAQVLEEQSPAENDNIRSLITMMLQGCEQMEEMVEGMLTLSRVDQEELSIKPIDLKEVVDEIILDLRALEPDRKVQLSLPESLEVNGDKRLMRILLQNLLSNAWKYSRAGESLDISVTLAEQKNEQQVSVRDNGIGFSMHSADDLFRPFKRLHKDHDAPGSGIGLATARRVVHRHGGRIWAESRPGEGAEFFFTLPSGSATPV